MPEREQAGLEDAELQWTRWLRVPMGHPLGGACDETVVSEADEGKASACLSAILRATALRGCWRCRCSDTGSPAVPSLPHPYR